MSRRKMAGFLVLCLIWGSTWAAIRVAVQHMPPLRGVSLRFLLGFVVLCPIAILRRSRLPVGREWGVLLLAGVLLIDLPFSLVAWGEQRISSGLTSVLFATSPLVTAWMEPYMGDDRARPTRLSRLGMLLGLGGVALMLYGQLRQSRADFKAAAVILAVVLAGAGISIVSKRELKTLPVLTIATVQSLLAGVSLGIASLLVERNHRSHWTTPTLFSILFLGVASTAVGFLLYYWLMMALKPHQLASRFFIMPVIAIGEGALLLGESLPWSMIVGTLVVMGGVAFVLKGNVEPVDAPISETNE